MSSRRFRSSVAGIVVLVAALVVAGCSASESKKPGSADPAPPAISITPASGAKDVDPKTPVQVTAGDGVLTSVTMTNEKGKPIEGIFTPDKTAWKPPEPVGYGHSYTITAEGLTITG